MKKEAFKNIRRRGAPFPKMFSKCFITRLNPLPNHQILDMTKLKAFAEDKLKVDKMTISFLDRVENTEGKGQNAGYHHFLLFPHCYLKPCSLRLFKVGIVW